MIFYKIKNVSGVYAKNKVISKVYFRNKEVWSADNDFSCFNNKKGGWNDNLPWNDAAPWVD